MASLVTSENEDIRKSVAVWLGKYGDERTTSYLKQLLADPASTRATMKSSNRWLASKNTEHSPVRIVASNFLA